MVKNDLDFCRREHEFVLEHGQFKGRYLSLQCYKARWQAGWQKKHRALTLCIVLLNFHYDKWDSQSFRYRRLALLCGTLFAALNQAGESHVKVLWFWHFHKQCSYLGLSFEHDVLQTRKHMTEICGCKLIGP